MFFKMQNFYFCGRNRLFREFISFTINNFYIFFFPYFVQFLCKFFIPVAFLDAAIASLYEGMSVRWSVGPSVRWSVGPSVRRSVSLSVIRFFWLSKNRRKWSKMTFHFSTGFLFQSFTLNLSFNNLHSLSFTILLSKSSFKIFFL